MRGRRGMRVALAGAFAVFVLAGKVRGNAIRTVSDMGLLHRAKTAKPVQVASKTCDNGFSCAPPKDCCPQGCCYQLGVHTPYLPSGHGPYGPAATSVLSAVFWNHWFFWSLLALLLLSCSGGCSLWRRRHELDLLGCQGCGQAEDPDEQSDRDSTASCYPPPQYSRCNSFSQPPPYSEVTSKPDLYPLVISYNDNSAKGGSYLMVQYLRHYFLRPAGGSLSHTSTADSISSSYARAAANAEALNAAPPQYVTVANGGQVVVPPPPPLPPWGAALPPALPPPPTAAARADARRPLPSSASMPSVCSLPSSRLSSRSGSRTASRTGSRSQTQSYSVAQSMAVGEWSNSGSMSVSVQPVRPAMPARPTSLPQAHPYHGGGHQGCSGTVSEVSSLLGEVSPSSPPRALSPSAPAELRLLLEQIDSLTGTSRAAASGAGAAHSPGCGGAAGAGGRLGLGPLGPLGLGLGARARRGWVACRTSRSAPCTPMTATGPQPSVFQPLLPPPPLASPRRHDDDPPSPAPSDPPRRTLSTSSRMSAASAASSRRHRGSVHDALLLLQDDEHGDALA